MADRATFEVTSSQTFAGTGYDLVTSLTACTTWATRSARPGTSARRWLVVKPLAADRVEDNFNPVGPMYYNFSSLLCVPNGLSQPGGYALGNQAGEAQIRQVMTDAGFTRFRRDTETPFTRSSRCGHE